MKLSDYEKSILAGDFGNEAKKIIEVMIKIYEINDAQDFVEAKEVMLGSTQNMSIGGTLGMEFLTRLADSGIRFKARTITNPVSIDLTAWRQLGIHEDYASNQIKSVKALIKMGAVPTWTCTPYLIGSIPCYGDHLAYVETSVVIFANTYFGGKTNREMDISALAAAITGRIPCYGMHLDDAREGQLLIHLEADLQTNSDYDALGYYVGKIAETKIPVFENMKKVISTQAMMQLGATLATSGAVSLFHIFETTPEIRSNPYKYGKKSIQSEVTVTQDDIKKTYLELNTTQNRDIDFVALGCPHHTFDKIKEVASFLEGKRIKNDVEVWICTSQAIRNLALRSGEVQIIESAGAKVVVDTCMVLAPVKEIGFRNMATDSAKAQFYVSGFGMGVRFGNTHQCLQSALTGKWEE